MCDKPRRNRKDDVWPFLPIHIFTMCCVAARLYSKSWIIRKFSLDDWVIAITYILYIGWFLAGHIPYNWEGWKGDFGPKKCFDLNALSWATSAIGIALDAVILVLPMPLVVKVKSTPRRKFMIILMFSLGIIIVIASSVRLRFNILYGDSVNITWDYVDLMIWTGVEVATSITVTSLPSIRLMIHKLFPGLFGRIFAFGGHVEQDREQYLEIREAQNLNVEETMAMGLTRRERKPRLEHIPPPTIGGGTPREWNQRRRNSSAPNENTSMSKIPAQTEASRVLASIMGTFSGSRSFMSQSASDPITDTTDPTAASEKDPTQVGVHYSHNTFDR
ncbi:CFEM domain-containing protein [Colletotrichum tofieldiae]|nr:CFEM domain-containing protein [Colletotrichum tofieldiae]